MKTKFVLGMLMGIGLCLITSVARADSIKYFIGVDDYGSLSINGTLLATYDSGGAGLTTPVAVTLAAGWYDITLDYKNRWGTDWLGFYWGDWSDPAAVVDIVPEAYLRSQDSTGQWVSGLRADYYTLDSNEGRGTLFQTIYGEGPIANGGNSYEGYDNGGYWPGVGYWGIFEEYLTGQIYVGASPPPAVPEPATLLLLGAGLAGLGGITWRRQRK